MNDRLRKVIALMDSSAESEAAAAFGKARELLRQDGRKFRDLLNGTRHEPGPGRPSVEHAELHVLRGRIAELEWRLYEADARAETGRGGLDAVERHVDNLDRKYKAALEQKDKAIAKLRRELARAGRRGTG